MGLGGKRSESDLALLERLEKLYVAVVADCFDGLGVRRNLLAPHVRSLYPGARLAGYALTVTSRWMSLRAAKTGSGVKSPPSTRSSWVT